MNNKSGSERGDHECVFGEEQEPDGRLILVPCLECGTPAIEAIKHGKNIETCYNNLGVDFRRQCSQITDLQKLVEEQKGEIERLKATIDSALDEERCVMPRTHTTRTEQILMMTEINPGSCVACGCDTWNSRSGYCLKCKQLAVKEGRFVDPQVSKLSSQLAEQKAEVERLNKAEKSLDDQLAIQLAEPSIKTDAYMAGLANGMLLAKANFGGDYNPISYKDSRLAEQTERVKALISAGAYLYRRLKNISGGSDKEACELWSNAVTALNSASRGIAKLTIHQESLGDGGKEGGNDHT